MIPLKVKKIECEESFWYNDRMKKQVVFIHGGEAFSKYENFIEHLKTTYIDDPFQKEPRKRWQSRLFKDLGEEYEVIAPGMPNKQNAKYEEWKLWFERYLPFMRDGVTLIGHSQGGYFLAKYLVENVPPVRIGAMYLLAAPFKPDDFGGEDGGDFAFDTEKLGNMAQCVDHIYIFHSKDDDVVPFRHAELYAEALPDAKCVIFDNKGHFLAEIFSELIEHIKKGI
jgi:hypothetical protein